ncbi:MAG: bifunctional 4-hydroxy-3-methylbut-2-enyl diphosphate reductase/30S ribosomal protein S1 [Clostridia bacterium]|nr:bifunctional 4-hydroxy-3-methylbut-2-enyl diphosphate reductase/30S ribosomal protein S1 [Clostridia bacterium]
MAEIILAQSAGFCFGVNRAVQTVYDLLEQGKKVSTLGPIIHNPQLVEELAQRGVTIVQTPCEADTGRTLVIRSHGVPAGVIEEAENCGLSVVDATCPFVAKIHSIVREKSRQGKTVLVAGDKAHKEVAGIVGHCSGPCYVFADERELEILRESGKISLETPLCVVSQTTFHANLWKKCQKFLKRVYTNVEIFDTICNATAKRQAEAAALAQQCDVMVVVGGRHSSNTAKLKEVCFSFCDRTVFVETAADLNMLDVRGADKIGVVAGASTPAGIIKEVIHTMSEMENQATEKNFDEMSFEEALEAFEAEAESNSLDKRVKGVVLSVNPTEIQVDIGRKHTGYVSAEEYSADSSVKLTDEVKVGDVLELMILRTNDQEGTVALSKRRVDAIAGWDAIHAAHESGEVLTGKVTEIVKGGVVTNYKGVRVFIPASQATLSRNDSLEELKDQEVNFKIIEIGRGRRVIGSIRTLLLEKKKELEAKFWDGVAVGDKFTGKVKSLTGYGAFVDLGGVDGMVHISELSWQRIKNPAEVVSVGDTIEVYVKGIDAENKKISLGYKKADENPWVLFENNYNVGDVITVKIVSMTSYGAFARIIPGIDGLIHISKIANKRVEKPQDELKIGQEVEVKITEIDLEKKRISLSIRDLLEPEEVAAEAPEVVEEAPVVEATEEAAE